MMIERSRDFAGNCKEFNVKRLSRNPVLKVFTPMACSFRISGEVHLQDYDRVARAEPSTKYTAIEVVSTIRGLIDELTIYQSEEQGLRKDAQPAAFTYVYRYSASLSVVLEVAGISVFNHVFEIN